MLERISLSLLLDVCRRSLLRDLPLLEIHQESPVRKELFAFDDNKVSQLSEMKLSHHGFSEFLKEDLILTLADRRAVLV